MKRKLKVIQINGFKGIIITLFVLSCTIAGFIGFPAFLSMSIWNIFAENIYSIPSISIYGGLLLWGIIACSLYLANRKKVVFSVNSANELSEEEVKQVISRIKMQELQNQIIASKESEPQTKEDSDSTITSNKEN